MSEHDLMRHLRALKSDLASVVLEPSVQLLVSGRLHAWYSACSCS